MMRCAVCYHNCSIWHGLCGECLTVVYNHHAANVPITMNRDPLGIKRPVLAGVVPDGAT